MTNWDDTDLGPVEARLRDERYVGSPVELDDLKQRAMRQASRAAQTGTGLSRRGRVVTALLVGGLSFGVASAGVVAGQGSSSPPPSAAISQYEQEVLPEVVVPGTARLIGPKACVSKSFTFRVRGQNIASVVYRVDGRKLKTVKTPDSLSRFNLKLNTKRFSTGVHRLTARVTFKAETKREPTTLRATFERCRRNRIAPEFTG